MTVPLKICDRIVKEARSLVGTPFRHQGRQPGMGLDCLGLLVCIATRLRLRDREGRPLSEWDDTAYDAQPDPDYLAAGLARHLIPAGTPRCGHVGLFTCGGRATHLAVFAGNGEGLTLIHAYAPAGKVVEHGFRAPWTDRLVRTYALP